MSEDRDNATLLELAQQWLVDNEIEYDPSSLGWQRHGDGVKAIEIRHKMMFEHNIGGTKIEMLMTMLESKAKDACEEVAKAWVRCLEPRSSAAPDERDAALDRFLRLMERDDTSDAMHQAHLLVMRQWIWQVKRHIINDPHLPVMFHIVPIFWSREGGTGKSVNVERILSPAPLARYVRRMAVNDLTKSFMTPLLSTARVGFLEEFAGAHRVEAGKLKALLTKGYLEDREIFQSGGIKKKNRLACIATSNLHPPFDFYDETGGRRFWPLHCSGERAVLGSARLDALDLTCLPSLWSCVSYEDEAPLGTASKEMRDLINKTQESTMRSATSLAEFCHEALVPHQGSDISFSELHSHYREYCRKWNLPVLSGGRRAFAQLLADLGIRTTHTGNVYMVKNHAWQPGVHAID